jgi:hypothetical protein
MNTLAQYLGTPTYPLNDGMYVGHRTPRELQYLIEKGFFAHYSQHHLIVKQHDRYQLLRNTQPEPELESEAPTHTQTSRLHT